MHLKIHLYSIEEVKLFLEIICKYEEEFWLVQEKKCVNAKDVEGIFMLDLQKTMELRVEKLKNNLHDKLSEELYMMVK